MASCMECIHFNPCNSHNKIIVEKPTEGNDWRLQNKVENECKYFKPTADVVEVKRGYWIDKPSGRYLHIASWCSVCGNKSGIGGIESNRHKPYCPNCGADMRGDEK